jgi:hypothetical protein
MILKVGVKQNHSLEKNRFCVEILKLQDCWTFGSTVVFNTVLLTTSKQPYSLSNKTKSFC